MTFSKLIEIYKHIPNDNGMNGLIFCDGRKRDEWRIVGANSLELLARTFIRMDIFVEPYVRKILLDINK